MTNSTPVDPEELPIARVYAEALWKIAQRDQVTGDVIEEWDTLIHNVLDQDASIERFFRSLTVGRDQRSEVIRKAFEGKVSDLIYQFLVTLNRHDRLGLVRACGVALHELDDQGKNIVAVEVRSAVELTDEQSGKVEQLIRQRFGVEPRLSTQVDQSLLGGLWIRVGDTVLDRTIRTNLRKLRDVIQTRNSYEIQSGRSFFDSPSGN